MSKYNCWIINETKKLQFTIWHVIRESCVTGEPKGSYKLSSNQLYKWERHHTLTWNLKVLDEDAVSKLTYVVALSPMCWSNSVMLTSLPNSGIRARLDLMGEQERYLMLDHEPGESYIEERCCDILSVSLKSHIE